MTPARFRVLVMPRVASDLDAAFDFIAADSPQNAAAWYDRCIDSIERLRFLPKLWPRASEPDLAALDVRGCICDGFRILFLIKDQTVQVVWVRHAAMNPLTSNAFLTRLHDR